MTRVAVVAVAGLPQCTRAQALLLHRATAVLALLLLLPHSPLQAAQQSRTHITAAELFALIQAGNAPPVIDVRTRSEFDKGHVPGALHIPFWAAFARTKRIPAGRDEPVVVYCAHGPRAGFARAVMRLAGFEQVLYLEGHMSAWKRAGFPQDRVEERP